MTAENSKGSGATNGYLVPPHGREPLDLDGHKLTMLATREDTDGRLSVFEARNVPSSIADRHIHHDAVKTIYVLEGTYLIHVGERGYEVGPGSFVFVPRHAPHHFEVGPEGGRLLFVFSPAGMEHYFMEEAQLFANGRRDEESVADLYRRYDVEAAPMP